MDKQTKQTKQTEQKQQTKSHVGAASHHKTAASATTTAWKANNSNANTEQNNGLWPHHNLTFNNKANAKL